MAELLKGIVLDIDKSLGTLKFVGNGREQTRRTPVGQTVVTERIYNLRSNVQKGNIEIIVKGNKPPLSFNVLEEVALVNAVLETGSQSSRGMSSVVSKIYVDNIVLAKDAESMKKGA